MPYATLKRMFAGSEAPDLSPVFDGRLVSKEQGRDMARALIVQNSSSRSAPELDFKRSRLLMPETSKRIKRLVREYAAIAHDRELGQALRDLDVQFGRWRNGEISAAELNDVIHQFHDGAFTGSLAQVRHEPPGGSAWIRRRNRHPAQGGATGRTAPAPRGVHRLLRGRTIGVIARVPTSASKCPRQCPSARQRPGAFQGRRIPDR